MKTYVLYNAQSNNGQGKQAAKCFYLSTET